MTARLTGQLFNDDLYHIHIHMKKGIKFLEAELKSVTRHHDLNAGQVMGENLIFFRPVETVGTIVDVLKTCNFSTFPVVEKGDNLLYGTIPRHVLCALLKKRCFGRPTNSTGSDLLSDGVEHHGEEFVPIAEWEIVEGSYPKYPSVADLRIGPKDRACLVDLRPYANTAPITVQESASVDRTYQVFRSLGLRFLPVVNKRNQIVGTITRDDLCPEGLAQSLMKKGKQHHM